MHVYRFIEILEDLKIFSPKYMFNKLGLPVYSGA